MKIADVMTRDVVSISKDTSIHEAAELLLAKNISAVPVIDENRRVIGIVSEADLMRRAEIGTEPRWSFWQHLSVDPERTAADYLRAHSRRVTDIMTRNVATVSEDASLPNLIAVMQKRNVKRAPVVKDGKLVGIVSRSDLVRELFKRSRGREAVTGLSDNEIRDHLTAHLKSQPWRPTWGYVSVDNGIVTLSGRERSSRVRRACAVAAENTPGVIAVRDLFYRGNYSDFAL